MKIAELIKTDVNRLLLLLIMNKMFSHVLKEFDEESGIIKLHFVIKLKSTSASKLHEGKKFTVLAK